MEQLHSSYKTNKQQDGEVGRGRKCMLYKQSSSHRAQPPCSSFCPAPSPIPPFLCAQHTPPAPLPRLVAALVASSGRPSLDGQSLFSQLTGLISQLPKGNFPEYGLALLLELHGHPANVTQIQLLDDSLWLVCPFWTQLVVAKEIPFIYFFIVY